MRKKTVSDSGWSQYITRMKISTNYLLSDVLEYLGLDTSDITSLLISFIEALDPHVNRRRYTEWWA